MVKNGTRPLFNPPKRAFHKNFGGVGLAQIPDFNLDAGLWMPDQNADGAGTECTGYTVCDIKTDFDKQLYSPDWQFAKTIQLENTSVQQAVLLGLDFHVAMQSAVVFGSLKKNDAPLYALEKGESFTADISNWPFSPLNTEAIVNAEIGTYNALGNGDAFTSILSAAYVNKMGVSIGSVWYPEWEHIGAGNGKMVPGSGIVSMPADVQNSKGFAGWHNWVIKGKITINGIPYAIGKSWQGKDYGAGGFHYIDQATLNAIMSVSGTGAISFADSGNRFINICIIFFSTPQLIQYLPQIIQAEMTLPQAKIISQRIPK